MTIEVEQMSEEFTKYHIKGLPFPLVLHHFTGPDKGLPHDHPWGFVSTVLQGGYIERVYHISADGSWKATDIHRYPGTSFHIPPEHIHEIISLPEGECWTLIKPDPWARHGGFWDFSKTPPEMIPFRMK